MCNEHTEQPPSVIDEPKDLIAGFHGARTAVVFFFFYFAIVWLISGGPTAIDPGSLLISLLWFALAWGLIGGIVGLIAARTPNSLIAMISGGLFAAASLFGYSFVRGSGEMPIELAAYYGTALVGSISAAIAKRNSSPPRIEAKKWTFSMLDSSAYILLAAILFAWIGEQFRETSSQRMIYRAGGRIVWNGTWGIEFGSQYYRLALEDSKLKDLAPALRRFPNLRLRFTGCKLSNVVVQELETLPNLKLLFIDPNMYSEGEIQELQDRLPKAKVVTDIYYYYSTYGGYSS